MLYAMTQKTKPAILVESETAIQIDLYHRITHETYIIKDLYFGY